MIVGYSRGFQLKARSRNLGMVRNHGCGGWKSLGMSISMPRISDQAFVDFLPMQQHTALSSSWVGSADGGRQTAPPAAAPDEFADFPDVNLSFVGLDFRGDGRESRTLLGPPATRFIDVIPSFTFLLNPALIFLRLLPMVDRLVDPPSRIRRCVYELKRESRLCRAGSISSRRSWKSSGASRSASKG